MYDEFGDLHQRVVQDLDVFWDSSPTETGEYTFHAHLHQSNPADEYWKSLRLYFGWQSEQVIQDTYKVTSRFGGTVPQHDYLKKHFESRNPVFNISRRKEPVATDTVFSDTPAINDGSTMAQFSAGKDTLVWDAYGIKSQKQFINPLYDNILTRGAMDTIITDSGKYEISKKVADLLRSLFINHYESEPYHQHQNKAEQRYGVVKRYINTLMNITGALAHCWLLVLVYISKHSQKSSSTLWLLQNLRSYKDMFLLCTKHSLAQDLEEHVGMTVSLTYFSRWTSNLQKQILTYG